MRYEYVRPFLVLLIIPLVLNDSLIALIGPVETKIDSVCTRRASHSQGLVEAEKAFLSSKSKRKFCPPSFLPMFFFSFIFLSFYLIFQGDVD